MFAPPAAIPGPLASPTAAFAVCPRNQARTLFLALRPSPVKSRLQNPVINTI